MEPIDYYNDKKWCPECQEYVAYLMSIEHSFCVGCGGEVRLFSKDDWTSFHESLQSRKPKGGRPRKQRTRGEVAAKRPGRDQRQDRESA